MVLHGSACIPYHIKPARYCTTVLMPAIPLELDIVKYSSDLAYTFLRLDHFSVDILLLPASHPESSIISTRPFHHYEALHFSPYTTRVAPPPHHPCKSSPDHWHQRP
jgi:hypothetical protein